MTSDQFSSLRKLLDLTQADLAEYLGTVQPVISRIERGDRQPTRQQAAAILLLAQLIDCREHLLPGANKEKS